MRGKRAKAYRKLMHKYELFFKFRQPYQIIVDAEFLEQADKCKMDLGAYLSRSVQGEIKPMITHCSIRHLYASSSKSNPQLVQFAKSLELRRCNHHTLENPLSTYDCLTSVIHPGTELKNKHRYVIATQDSTLRRHLRTVPGVPIIYIERSVMILEGMSDVSKEECLKQEHAKFTEGILEKIPNLKRKREGGPDEGAQGDRNGVEKDTERGVRMENGASVGPERKKKRGPMAPNPLSVKKKKTKEDSKTSTTTKSKQTPAPTGSSASAPTSTTANGGTVTDSEHKKRRRRKRKPGESSAAPDED